VCVGVCVCVNANNVYVCCFVQLAREEFLTPVGYLPAIMLEAGTDPFVLLKSIRLQIIIQSFSTSTITRKWCRVILCGAFMCRSPEGGVVGRDGGIIRAPPPQKLRVIVPPGSVDMPTRMTCRLIGKERLRHPPQLRVGQALASRIVEVTPPALKFHRYVLLKLHHQLTVLSVTFHLFDLLNCSSCASILSSSC